MITEMLNLITPFIKPNLQISTLLKACLFRHIHRLHVYCCPSHKIQTVLLFCFVLLGFTIHTSNIRETYIPIVLTVTSVLKVIGSVSANGVTRKIVRKIGR